MITIKITPQDLARLRFAYSPLLELSFSYRVLTHPAKQAPYQEWVHQTQRAVQGGEFPYLEALYIEGYIADFITPTPTEIVRNVEDALGVVRDTPDEVVRRIVQQIIHQGGATPMREFYLHHTRAAVDCLIEELRVYWEMALARHWPALLGVAENDVLYRARQLALEGAEGLLDHLHPLIHYTDGAILIKKDVSWKDEARLQGGGLQIVPVVFANATYQVEPDWRPMVIYNPRGVGLWKPEAPESDPALELILGESKTRILHVLATHPQNTGELSRRLHLTPGAISQHLGQLHQAGLVLAQRSGAKVFYRLSARGENLLAVFQQ